MTRDAAVARFLAAAGRDTATVEWLPGDASFRRYARLRDERSPALLMDAPPPTEDVRPFLVVARHLRGLGLSAPRIMAADEAAGLLLIEDFGDDTYTRLLAAGADETALYALAVDTLIALQRRPDAATIALPRYDDDRLLDEAVLLVDWYLPAVRGVETPAAVRESWLTTWRAVLPAVRRVPETLVLRDYHVDNLMRLPGRPGVAACGLLDFQDALIGPAAYDLVSLLEDARRDVPPELARAMTARYLDAFPALDRRDFAAASAVLAAQRHAKVIGIFTRLDWRDGKARYLAHLPRLWRLLGARLADPALAPVRLWLDEHLPPDDRRIPLPRAA